MRNNKRQAKFGMPKGYFDNPRMYQRSQKVRKWSVVEIDPDALFSEWSRDQLTGKRGTVVKTPDIWWDTDYRGRKYVGGAWGLVARFSGTNRIGGNFGLDHDQVIVISPRELRTERLRRNEERRHRQLSTLQKLSDTFVISMSNIKNAFGRFAEGIRTINGLPRTPGGHMRHVLSQISTN